MRALNCGAISLPFSAVYSAGNKIIYVLFLGVGDDMQVIVARLILSTKLFLRLRVGKINLIVTPLKQKQP